MVSTLAVLYALSSRRPICLLCLATLATTADGRLAARKNVFPELGTLAVDPLACDGIALEIAIDVTKARLEKLEEWIAEGRIHANHFARMIGTDTMPCEGFLEQGLFVCAATIEITRRSLTRGIGATFATRVVPCAEGIAGAVESTEALDAGVCPGPPRGSKIL